MKPCVGRYAVLGLLLLTCVVHGRSIGFDFVNWDDDAFILQNTLVTNPANHSLTENLLTPLYGYAIPITNLSYALNYAVHGANPIGFHLVNLCLHILVVLGAFSLLRAWKFSWGIAASCGITGCAPDCCRACELVIGRKDLWLRRLRSLVPGTKYRDVAIAPYYAWEALSVSGPLSKPSVVGLGIILFAIDRGCSRLGFAKH